MQIQQFNQVNVFHCQVLNARGILNRKANLSLQTNIKKKKTLFTFCVLFSIHSESTTDDDSGAAISVAPLSPPSFLNTM